MLRRHIFFFGILLVAAVARFVLLIESQTHVHSDEAIIGLMAKHILEGRYLPFYMYGQSYNAGAAWESYLATIPFTLFGVGVIPLKSGIVCLSLVCLVLFYRMADLLYGPRTAALAALAFALSPSLLKWHFQVRGYSWYFLSLPLLVILFTSIQSSSAPRVTRTFLLGLVSGLSVWSLELALPPVAVLWALLTLRRKLSATAVAAGLAGLSIGYGPAIAFNLTHQFQNWREAFVEKSSQSTAWSSLLGPSTASAVLFEEMPKFFGPDTVLWYYPEKPLSGYVFYAIAVAAVAAASWPFFRRPWKIPAAVSGSFEAEDKDLLMVILTLACLAPYLIARTRVPSYFFGGTFFLSVLAGRLLERCFNSSAGFPRLCGGALSCVMLIVGVGVLIDTGRRNEIETLTMDKGGKFHLTRIPARDIEAVEHFLRDHRLNSAWATLSFVYPLIFDSGERWAVSDAIFGWDHRVYPESVPWRWPDSHQPAVFVMETEAPLRMTVETRCRQLGGEPPLVARYGTLTLIEGKPLLR